MFESVVPQFLALGGFAALIAVVVNVLKLFNVVKEDDAPKWVGGLNLLGILVMYGFRLFNPAFAFSALDPTMMEIATVATFILSYVAQLGISKITHLSIKGTPFIGKSYSLDAAKADRAAVASLTGPHVYYGSTGPTGTPYSGPPPYSPLK
jgi:hypothetical protein